MRRSFPTPDAVEAAFYQAFRDLDLALMEQVWDDELEPLCVHPAGVLLRGKMSVMQSWAQIFERARRPSMVLHTQPLTDSGELAIHIVEELIRPRDRPESEPARVVATNIFRRGSDGWHLLVHHASLPLIEGQPASPQMLLH